MRLQLILIATLLTAACNPPPQRVVAVDPGSFAGNWYGVRPEGVTTFHSDSTFNADGTVVVRFFSCLSSQPESQWVDRGTWSYSDGVLTLTLTSDTDRENSERYTHRYSLLTDDYDQRTFRSESGNYTFWLKRRWRDQPFDCSTRKADLDADRAGAIADGRFQAAYPDFQGETE